MNITPYSPIARAIAAPRRLQLLCAAIFVALVCAYPLLEIVDLNQQLENVQQDNQQLAQQQQQKQQVIAVLQQKTVLENSPLDPQLAAQIPALNQQIQQAVATLNPLKISQQAWQFSAMPLLQLELEGRFYAISHLLQQLPTQFTELKLIRLELQHPDNQPHTRAKLTLLLLKESISDD